MKLWNSKKLRNVLWISNGLAGVICIQLLASLYFFRWDLTEEKRYTIKEPTRSMLNNLDDKVYIEVFMKGDLNAKFKRFQRATREILEEMRVISKNRIQYSFINPASAYSQKARNEFMQDLVSKGIDPINIIDRKGDERTEKIVFPGALINYNGFEKGVMLLKSNRAQTPDQVLNQSIEELEFSLANTIYQLVNTDRKRIGIITGHGELDSLEIASFNNALWDQYDVYRVNLQHREQIENYDALIIAKPTTPFSKLDQWKIDQYIMQGGKVLWLIDQINATMDSAYREDYYAFPYGTNLDNMLFKYGVRINHNLIQDKVAASYPIVTGHIGNQPQFTTLSWYFFPLISHYSDHVITKNLDVSRLQFVSTIDTVGAKGIKKTPLMFSSAISRKLSAPVKISVADLRNPTQFGSFQQGPFAIGYLLEGVFRSIYKNRILPDGVNPTDFKMQSFPTKMIIVSDGDIARNSINKQTKNPQQLGYDPISRYTFANQDLLLNMVAYLTDATGMIRARNKDVKIRPLNKAAISEHRELWQAVNILIPLLLLYIYGIIQWYIRKKKYTV